MPDPISVVVTNASPETVTITAGSSSSVEVINGGGVTVTVGDVVIGDPAVIASSVQVGTVDTLEPGEEATVENVGSAAAAILNFGIPRGATGAAGASGSNGISPTITIGDVSTGPTPSIENVGTNTNQVWDFVFPEPTELPIAIGDVSGLQAALDAKAQVTHSHEIEDVDGLADALDLATTQCEAPATATAIGVCGQMAVDSNWLYVAVGTNTWKRVPLELFSGSTSSGGITITQQPQSQTLNAGNYGYTQSAGLNAAAYFSDAAGNLHAFSNLYSNRFYIRRANVSSWTQFDGIGSTNEPTEVEAGGKFRYVAQYNQGTLAVKHLWRSFNEVAGDDHPDRMICTSVPANSDPTWSAELSAFSSAVPSGESLYDYGSHGVASAGASGTAAVMALSRAAVGTYGGPPLGFRRVSVEPIARRTTGNWIRIQIDGAPWAIHDVRYAGGRYVAIGERGSTPAAWSAYSTDGLSWSANQMPSGLWVSLAYGNGRWVAVGPHTTTPSAVHPNEWGVYCKAGNYYSESTGGQRGVCVSTNGGLNWTNYSTALPALENWRSVVYHDGRFIAFPLSGTFIAHSTDGVTWSSADINSSITYDSHASRSVDLFVAGNTTTGPGIVTATAGGAVTFSVQASAASGTLSYQWLTRANSGSNASEISGATSSSVTVSGLTLADNGRQYACLLTRTGGDLGPGESVQLYTTWATLTVI